VNLEAIIRGCLEGNEGDWKMLVDLFSKKVFNLAYQFSGSYQEAQDLTQEIFVKLFGALPKYEFGKNFSAWLTTLAKNHLIDEYRRTKWEKKNRDDFDDHLLSAAAPNGDPEKRLLQTERQRILWAGLNQLPPDIRLAVLLKEIQGKSYEETAEITGVPEGTVKSRVNRGRLQLARILQKSKEDANDL
jgi:RNA polymerase sigma-70 factor (ECF subfamily)